MKHFGQVLRKKIFEFWWDAIGNYEKKPCGTQGFHSAFEEELGDHGSVWTPAKTQGVTDDIDIEMVRKSQEFQTATPTFTT